MQNTLSDANVVEYLRGQAGAAAALGGPGGPARAEPAGDGNINWVRRVRGPGGSLVVKQAGPALLRFPEYAVSPDRILHEARYYASVAPFDTDRVCPAVLGLDAANHVLLLEDLGEAERLDAALARGAAVGPALERLASFLGRVHAGTRGAALLAPFPDATGDTGVLALHLEHIFALPFAPNDFPLPPALRRAAAELAADADLLARIARLRTACAERAALVHGDVQPTNILLAAGGPKLLDAEIAHAGLPALDVGIWLAHLVLAALARGAPAESARDVAPPWRAYGEAHGSGAPDFAIVAAFAGVEILRRTLGAARVPAVARDEALVLEAVRLGARLVRRPPDSPAGLAPAGRGAP